MEPSNGSSFSSHRFWLKEIGLRGVGNGLSSPERSFKDTIIRHVLHSPVVNSVISNNDLYSDQLFPELSPILRNQSLQCYKNKEMKGSLQSGNQVYIPLNYDNIRT